MAERDGEPAMNNGFLEQLAMFVAIARTGSLTAAATQLGLLQPTVSRQLNALESDVGAKLIHRTTRALTLTDRGEELLRHAVPVIRAAQEARSSVARTSDGFAGTLRVTCSHAFGNHVLIPALETWQRQHPGVGVDLHLSDSIEPIVANGFDLAFRPGPLLDSNLVARQFGAYRQILVASREYLRRHGEIASPEQLNARQCIAVVVQGHIRNWLLQSGADKISVAPNAKLTLNNMDALRRAVLAGLGVGLAPAWVWSDELKAGLAVHLLPEWNTHAEPIYAISSVRHPRGSREAAFVDVVEAAFAPHCVAEAESNA